MVSEGTGKSKHIATVNLDFDPFESEEEFVIEQSEQLSAIDAEVYKDILDKVERDVDVWLHIPQLQNFDHCL